MWSEELVKAIKTSYPVPIADAVIRIKSADSAHEQRDRVVEVFRATVRYLAGLTLAARLLPRKPSADDPEEAQKLLRKLRQKGLTDGEWLGLARELTRPWAGAEEQYPVPELVRLFHSRSGKHGRKTLDELLAMRKGETVAHWTTGDVDQVIAILDERVPQLGELLRDVSGICESYRLVIPTDRYDGEPPCQQARLLRGFTPSGGYWERTALLPEQRLPADQLVLATDEGRLSLPLEPAVLVLRPEPASPEECFFLEGVGSDRQGRLVARYVSIPRMREHAQDCPEALNRLTRATDESVIEPVVQTIKEPYRGLSPFGPEHAPLFFGRERESEELANLIRSHGLVTVTGASGVGKTSLLRAGVEPALKRREKVLREALEAAYPEQGGSGPYRQVHLPPEQVLLFLRPTSSPWESLRVALRQGLEGGEDWLRDDQQPEALAVAINEYARSRHQVVVVVVDQMEETLTLCHDQQEQERFATTLAGLGAVESGPTRLVLAVRGDFFARLAELGPLRGRYEREVFVVAGPEPAALLRTLTGPADCFQPSFRFETRLPEQIVEEVKDEHAALALLQFTAAALWEKRNEQGELTFEAYEAIEGVRGALSQHADALMGKLEEKGQLGLARKILLSLVTPDNTRAMVREEELVSRAGGDEAAGQVLAELVGARLVTADKDANGHATCELAHEALLTHWPTLARWREEDQGAAVQREHMRAAANAWAERKRPRGLLWRGDALAVHREWVRKHGIGLTQGEKEFIEASERADRRAKVVRWGIVAAVILTLSALGLYSWFRTLEAQQEEAAARLEIAMRDDPGQGLAWLAHLRSLRGEQPSDWFRAINASHDGVGWVVSQRTVSATAITFPYSIDEYRRLLGQPEAACERCWPNRKLVAFGDADGHVRIIDLDRPAAPFGLPRDEVGDVKIIRFSPDGQIVAAVIGTNVLKFARVDDVLSQMSESGVNGSPLVAKARFPYEITSLEIEASNNTIIIGTPNSLISVRIPQVGWSEDMRMELEAYGRGSINGRVRPILPIPGHPGFVLAATGDAGQLLALRVADGFLWTISIPTLRHVYDFTVRQDGRLAAVSGIPSQPSENSNDIFFIDLPSELGLEEVQLQASGSATVGTGCLTLLFYGDYQMLTGDQDGSVVEWRMRREGDLWYWIRGSRVRSHSNPVVGIREMAGILLTESAMGDVVVGRYRGASRTIVGHHGRIRASSLSPDGEIVATAGEDGTVRLWPTTAGLPWSTMVDGQIRSVAVAGDGVIWVAIHDGAQGRVVNLRSSSRLGEEAPVPQTDKVDQLELEDQWSGTSLPFGLCTASSTTAAAFTDGTVRIWNAGGVVRTHGVADSAVTAVGCLGDAGVVFAFVSQSNLELPATVMSWSGGEDDPRLLGTQDGQVVDVAVSPSGHRVATVSTAGSAVVWSLDTRQRQHLVGPEELLREIRPGTDIATPRDADMGERETSWSDLGLLSAVWLSEWEIALGSETGHIWVWELRSGRLRQLAPILPGRVLDLARTSNGRYLVAACADRNIHLWALDAVEDYGNWVHAQLNLGHRNEVTSVAFSDDGRNFVAGGAEGLLVVQPLPPNDPSDLTHWIGARSSWRIVDGEVEPVELPTFDDWLVRTGSAAGSTPQ